MKQATLLHGTGGNDKDYFWFEDTKFYLESKGYNVWWPQLPNPDKPELLEAAALVADKLKNSGPDDVIVAHSSACPLVLYLLQTLDVRLKQVILVAGFYQSLNDDGYSDLMLPKDGFDYEIIRAHAEEIILINSDNDPWGCDDAQARPIADKLGAQFIVARGQGHMGSTTFNQPYWEFPLVKQVLNV